MPYPYRALRMLVKDSSYLVVKVAVDEGSDSRRKTSKGKQFSPTS